MVAKLMLNIAIASFGDALFDNHWQRLGYSRHDGHYGEQGPAQDAIMGKFFKY